MEGWRFFNKDGNTVFYLKDEEFYSSVVNCLGLLKKIECMAKNVD